MDCYNYVSKELENEICRGRVIIDKNLSTDALSNYTDDSLDFIYIDACHLYESVLWDIEHYIKKLKKGGFIGGHDYFNHPSFGVIKAVDEFCLKHGYQILAKVDESNMGDWLLTARR